MIFLFGLSIIHPSSSAAAGYCVVTYILGVGDRHLDNLLLAPDGELSLDLSLTFVSANHPHSVQAIFSTVYFLFSASLLTGLTLFPSGLRLHSGT